MKTPLPSLVIAVGVVLAAVAGAVCNTFFNRAMAATEATLPSPCVEGVLFSVEYKLAGDLTGGFTRMNNAQAVPGGNGSWNIDAYGKLYPEFLIITRPKSKELGPQVIPMHRLVSVQFGDGGIKDSEAANRQSHGHGDHGHDEEAHGHDHEHSRHGHEH